MYAVVETGGKQYKVQQGDIIDVEKLPVTSGEEVILDHVILVSTGDKVSIGKDVENAKVIAEVLSEKKGKKITIVKFRRRKRYRRKIGHRQKYTQLMIKEIQMM